MTEKVELEPCPFCSDGGEPHQDNGHGAILCFVCHCHGPRGYGQDAIDLWNNSARAQSRIADLETREKELTELLKYCETFVVLWACEKARTDGLKTDIHPHFAKHLLKISEVTGSERVATMANSVLQQGGAT